MEDCPHMTAIPQDTSHPWSHVVCSSNGNGYGYGGYETILSETYCSSPEECASDSIPGLDHGDALTDVSSIKSFGAVNGSIDEGNGKLNKETSGNISSLLGLSEPPLNDGIFRYPNPYLEMDDDGDKAENALLVIKSNDATAAGQVGQSIRTAAAGYICGTEATRCSEVRVGCQDEIPRWIRDAVLYYVVCIESFPELLAPSVETAMRKAISMWRGHGVKFKQVKRNEKATFAVTYQDRSGKVYARSFFPNDESRKLIVYKKSCEEPQFLANILAHEIGHILGLRHEFADKKESDNPSVLLGIENPKSIMNYHGHVSDLQVEVTDLEGLSRLYAHTQPKYDLPIVIVDPEEWKTHFPSPSSGPASYFNSNAADTTYVPTHPVVDCLIVKPPILHRTYIFLFILIMLFVFLIVLILILFLNQR